MDPGRAGNLGEHRAWLKAGSNEVVPCRRGTSAAGARQTFSLQSDASSYDSSSYVRLQVSRAWLPPSVWRRAANARSYRTKQETGRFDDGWHTHIRGLDTSFPYVRLGLPLSSVGPGCLCHIGVSRVTGALPPTLFNKQMILARLFWADYRSKTSRVAQPLVQSPIGKPPFFAR